MTTLERDLKALRRSRLMMYSEFRTMMTALERYHKDITVGIMTGKKSKKELDLKPFLFDEGDSYERPFYGTLLKMLYEVAMSNYVEKQPEDLQKIYNWYQANKTLITSPPKVKIPTATNPGTSPSPSPSHSPSPTEEGAESGNDDSFDEEDLKELRKVPKLHMRPRTAPAVESRKGVRYVTWNEAQRNKGKSRPMSGHGQKKFSSQDNLARSLRISPYGPNPTGNLVVDRQGCAAHLQRPGTAPAHLRIGKTRYAKGLKSSFVLKPFQSTPAPTSSPAASPLSSSRASPVPFCRSKSPISVQFVPDIVKEPSVKALTQVAKQTEKQASRSSDIERRDTRKSSIEEGVTVQINNTDSADNISGVHEEKVDLQGASAEDLKRLIEQQNREEELLQEQQDLLQKKLLRDHDQYVKDCVTKEKEQEARVEMVNGQVCVTRDNGSHKPPLHVAPVGTYDLATPEVIPSYSRVYAPSPEAHQRSHSSGAVQSSGLSPARHVRHSTVPQQNSRSTDVIKVDAILGMVTPIGMQMTHDKERQERERIKSQRELLILGPKRSAVSIPSPSETRPNTTSENGIVRPPTPKPEILEQVLPQRGATDPEMKGPPLEMKYKEPELNPEKTTRDYTVHFPQPEKLEDGTAKSYKISGPVAPDTIRYQWTDDGFGGKTYMKRLKTPTSPRIPRKRPPNQSPAPQVKSAGSDHVTLPVGNRSLDKKTLASLMLVQRLNDRKAGGSRTVPAVQSSIEQDNVEYSYHLQYMNFCQPVGPRLGESDKPSSVNWYLQGEHGLYRDPSYKQATDSAILHSKRTEVRIPKDRSLMIEGKHIGGESAGPEVTKEELSSHSSSTIGSGQSSEDAQVELLNVAGENVTSPRGPSSTPRASASSPRKPIAVPTVTRSRPCSARSEHHEHSFNVKQFKHFCWPDDPDLTDDYKRQLEAWAAVNIQRIFRGHMARQYAFQLKNARNERERKAAVQLQSTFRGFLTRKRLMERRIMDYTPVTRTDEWSKQYQEDLKKRDAARQQKNQQLLLKQSKEFEKQIEQVKQVQATQNIFEAFHPIPEGPSKAEKKAAAIVIQKYFRGWFVRRMFKKVKEKALKRTLSFGKFTRNYQALLYRIQKRYGVEDPTTALQFNHLMEYVERLNKYEITFEKFAKDGVVKYKDIKEFFKACGHFPSQKEIDDAIAIVTKMSAKGHDLTKAEAVEVLFQIYVPKGTGLKLSEVRKSTWMNPLIDGQDAMQLLSKKDLEQTKLLKCLALVGGAEAESEAIKDLLRPTSAKKSLSPTGNSSSKKGAKNTNGKGTKGRKSSKGDVVLAQYPHNRPSSSGPNRSRSKR